MSESTKTCTGCNRELPLSAFGRLASAPDGLSYRCRECVNAQKREYHRANRKLKRVFTNPDLAAFTPRQLIDELKARGYSCCASGKPITGELKITQTIKV